MPMPSQNQFDKSFEWGSVFRGMHLRDHPLMKYRTLCNWPPEWVPTSGLRDASDTPSGEIGTLAQVLLSKIEPYNRCYLLINFKNEQYMGTLIFDDAAFCRQIH